jgi:Pilus formation protein N terminal region
MFVACCGRRRWLYSALGCLAAALAVVAHPSVGFATEPVLQSTLRDPVTVRLDQASLLKLPEGTATLVIGNPLIADAAVQGGVMVITAKSYGMTNLVILDRNGATMAEYPIQVTGPTGNLVVMYRGVERETYSCTPKCERRITLGDSQPYFTTNLTTLSQFSTLAQSGDRR